MAGVVKINRLELPSISSPGQCTWSSARTYQRALLASGDIRHGRLYSWALSVVVNLVAICSGKNEGCEAAALRLNHSLFFMPQTIRPTRSRQEHDPVASSRSALFPLAPPPDVTTILDPDWP
ncbi:hypothetical protein NDU88_001017 [Pleurodeles waltl]|uniref:Uncharacterized protein n=1 Tax=Pleurodeles waltl TaxID=8319 RepID=A0AAV7SYE3_PLEWA|nr:hypothetical protein NDU88_001017 [Pleurodeles waltl]